MSREYRTYRVDGVVIRRRNLGEADSIFTVFSEAGGKFEGIARGVRKTRSRMRGHLEPLTLSRFLMARGRSLDVFTQAETVRSFPGIGADLDRWTSATYCAELVDRFTVEHAENRELFRLFVDALDALDSGHDPALVARYFEFHLLAVSGFDLTVEACGMCGGRLPEEDALFAPLAGGLICRQCRPEAGTGRVATVRAIKVLRHAARVDTWAFATLRVDASLSEELESLLGYAIEQHLEARPRSSAFSRSLRSVPRTETPGSSTL